MRKLARLLFAAAICLLWAGSTYSETRISGRLSGEWPPPDFQRPDTGYVVYVIDGPSWIPAGSSLIIHGKVKIQILWPPAITVFGRMVTRASQDSLIVIEAVSNAEGFCFEGAAAAPDTLRHIQVSQDKFPRNALTSNGRALYVQNCELWASWAAICAYSACVEIRDCGIYKRGGGEAAIYLVGADGSLIIRNRIDVQFPDMLPDFPSTNGIYINTIQDGEISNNTIDIRGPGFTTGIFGESICHSLSIENNSIYCQSENLVPRGIGLKHAVYCAISACTVTVDSRSSAQAVLWLYGSTVAEVMNSSLSLGGAGFGELVHQEGGARVIMEGSEVEQGIRRAPNRKENLAPEAPQIGEAFPNPFNITTTIPLELRSASLIEVAIYNALGGEVERVSYGVLAEGRHHLNLSGHSWASGTYFVRVIAERRSVALRRVILVK